MQVSFRWKASCIDKFSRQLLSNHQAASSLLCLSSRQQGQLHLVPETFLSHSRLTARPCPQHCCPLSWCSCSAKSPCFVFTRLCLHVSHFWPSERHPVNSCCPAAWPRWKGKMGWAFTETGQAEVEIPKEKDAKQTVSSKDGEILEPKRMQAQEHDAKLILCWKENVKTISPEMKNENFWTYKSIKGIT